MIQLFTEDLNNKQMDIKIETAEDQYRLVLDGTPTEPSAYGESIEIKTPSGQTVMALIDVPEDGGNEVASMLDHWIYVDGKGVEIDEEMDIVDVDGFDGEEDEESEEAEEGEEN